MQTTDDSEDSNTYVLVKKDVRLRLDSFVVTESELLVKERLIHSKEMDLEQQRLLEEERRRLAEAEERNRLKEKELFDKLRQAEEAARKLQNDLREKELNDKKAKEAEEARAKEEERKRIYLEAKQKQLEEAKRRREEEEKRRAAETAAILEKKRAEDEAKRREIEKQLGRLEMSYTTPPPLQEEDHDNIPGWRKVYLTVLEARDLIGCNVHDGESDPFVVCKHLDPEGNIKVKHKTKVVQKNRTCPMWDQTMEYRDFEKDDMLEISVWDNGMTGFDFMGEVLLKRNEIKHGSVIWFALNDRPKHARKGAHPSQDRKFGEKKEKKEKEKKDKAFIQKPKLTGDKLFAEATKSRNVMKELVRGKRKPTGEVRLAFETIY